MEFTSAPRYVCRSCLARQRRSLSKPATQARALSTSGLSQLRTRRLIAVHGHDAAHFLQGLTTANIPTSGLLSSPSNPQVIYSAFMNAQGRLLHDVFIYPLHPQHALRETATGGKEVASNPAFVVEVDATQVQRLQAVLKKYKLRAKVTIRALEEEELGVFAAWNSGSAPASPALTAQNEEMPTVLLAQDPRILEPWQRILANSSEVSNLQQMLGLSAIAEDDYKIQRYLQGVPEGQEELPREDTLLHEANIDLMHGVDFRKGCYVGQELVIRTQHTGVVRKRVMPVQLWTDDAPAKADQDQDEPVYQDSASSSTGPLSFLIGQNIKTQGAKRPDGKLLGTAGNLGLALCRLERVIETEDSVAKGSTKTLQLDLSAYENADVQGAWLRPFIPRWWEERGKIMEGGYESLKVRTPGSKQ